jgi:hypothetical protein
MGGGWRGRVSWRPENQWEEAEEGELAGDQRTSGRRLARGESAGDARVEMGGESDLEARGPMGRDRRGRVTRSPVGGVRRGELAGGNGRRLERESQLETLGCRWEGRVIWKPEGQWGETGEGDSPGALWVESGGES